MVRPVKNTHRGETGDKQAVEDPAVAPLGTDAQAGGSSTGGKCRPVCSGGRRRQRRAPKRRAARSRDRAVRWLPWRWQPWQQRPSSSRLRSPWHPEEDAPPGSLAGPCGTGPLDPVIGCRCGADRRSAGYPPTSVENLEINTLWDGLVHATTCVFVVLGLIVLWRACRRTHMRWSSKLLVGSILLSLSVFNLVGHLRPPPAGDSSCQRDGAARAVDLPGIGASSAGVLRC